MTELRTPENFSIPSVDHNLTLDYRDDLESFQWAWAFLRRQRHYQILHSDLLPPVTQSYAPGGAIDPQLLNFGLRWPVSPDTPAYDFPWLAWNEALMQRYINPYGIKNPQWGYGHDYSITKKAEFKNFSSYLKVYDLKQAAMTTKQYLRRAVTLDVIHEKIAEEMLNSGAWEKDAPLWEQDADYQLDKIDSSKRTVTRHYNSAEEYITGGYKTLYHIKKDTQI